MEHGRSHVEKHKPICLCGQTGVRNDEHDAYYCPVGIVWLEKRCSDPKCTFCAQRPESPSEE